MFAVTDTQFPIVNPSGRAGREKNQPSTWLFITPTSSLSHSWFTFFHLPIYIILLLYHTWSSIVIVHEKKRFFCFFFFRNISKTAETILIKKIGRNHGISVYKKALISEHQKNYIFEIITVVSKCLLDC